MAKNKHILGLHTKEERQHAYTLVNQVYQRALKDLAEAPHTPSYALGYVAAVADLLRAEGEDEELMNILDGMRDDLLEKSDIPVG